MWITVCCMLLSYYTPQKLMWITVLHVAQCSYADYSYYIATDVCCMLIGIILALSVVGLVFFFIYNDDKEE